MGMGRKQGWEWGCEKRVVGMGMGMGVRMEA